MYDLRAMRQDPKEARDASYDYARSVATPVHTIRAHESEVYVLGRELVNRELAANMELRLAVARITRHV